MDIICSYTSNEKKRLSNVVNVTVSSILGATALFTVLHYWRDISPSETEKSSYSPPIIQLFLLFKKQTLSVFHQMPHSFYPEKIYLIQTRGKGPCILLFQHAWLEHPVNSNKDLLTEPRRFHLPLCFPSRFAHGTCSKKSMI